MTLTAGALFEVQLAHGMSRPAMPARLFLLVLLFASAAALLPPPVLARAVAGALTVSAEADGARVRLALNRAPAGTPTSFILDNPRRLVIDLPGVSTQRREAGGAGPIRAARIAQFEPGTARIVVEMAQPLALRAARLNEGPVLELDIGPVSETMLAATARKGRTMVLLGTDGPAPLADVEAALAGRPSPAVPAIPAVTPAQALARARERPLVVIDPGHGGKDVGAIAVTGTFEKDVTLAVAREAARALERSGKVQVRLTRTDDRFLTLGQRVALARGWGAALFISVHADSAPNADARGATVYTLSEVASDREAARLAAQENLADAIAGIDLSAEDGEAQTVLIDLALRDTMNASAQFAHVLQGHAERAGVPFRGQFHRFAGFQVLRNLGVPAVLFECGYLSNAEDARWLATADAQRRLGEGIARAAEAWLAPD